jgi:hypothetical protein
MKRLLEDDIGSNVPERMEAVPFFQPYELSGCALVLSSEEFDLVISKARKALVERFALSGDDANYAEKRRQVSRHLLNVGDAVLCSTENFWRTICNNDPTIEACLKSLDDVVENHVFLDRRLDEEPHQFDVSFLLKLPRQIWQLMCDVHFSSRDIMAVHCSCKVSVLKTKEESCVPNFMLIVKKELRDLLDSESFYCVWQTFADRGRVSFAFRDDALDIEEESRLPRGWDDQLAIAIEKPNFCLFACGHLVIQDLTSEASPVLCCQCSAKDYQSVVRRRMKLENWWNTIVSSLTKPLLNLADEEAFEEYSLMILSPEAYEYLVGKQPECDDLGSIGENILADALDSCRPAFYNVNEQLPEFAAPSPSVLLAFERGEDWAIDAVVLREETVREECERLARIDEEQIEACDVSFRECFGRNPCNMSRIINVPMAGVEYEFHSYTMPDGYVGGVLHKFVIM